MLTYVLHSFYAFAQQGSEEGPFYFRTIDYLVTNQRKEMSNCGTVSMDRYWSFIATPLFFVVIAFGTYTLFVTDDIQIVSTKKISDAVDQIRSATSFAKRSPADVANPAVPAK